MIIEINIHQFKKWINESDHYKKWSDETLDILWEWYEEQEAENGEPMKFDFVLIRSCWAEYDSIKELRDDYEQCVETTDDEFLKWMEDHTTIFKLSFGRFLIWSDF
jgi:hypothetical protein